MVGYTELSENQRASSGRGRRLTIAAGNHPCAEDRVSKHPINTSQRQDQEIVTKALEESMSPGSRPVSASHTRGSCASTESRPQSSRSRSGSRASADPFAEHKNNNNGRGSAKCRKGSCRDRDVDDEGISFLAVPNVPSRRPSTADVMIEKFRVERNDGGGLLISGVALSPHCHFTLIICGLFCLLAGSVLTYVAFGGANSRLMSSSSPPALGAFKSDQRFPHALQPNFHASEAFKSDFKASKVIESHAKKSKAIKSDFKASKENKSDFKPKKAIKSDFKPKKFIKSDLEVLKSFKSDSQPSKSVKTDFQASKANRSDFQSPELNSSDSQSQEVSLQSPEVHAPDFQSPEGTSSDLQSLEASFQSPEVTSSDLQSPAANTSDVETFEALESEFQGPGVFNTNAERSGALVRREDESPDQAYTRVSNSSMSKRPLGTPTKNLRIIGPVCIATGLLMILVGVTFFALGRKIQRDEKEQARARSEAQLDQIRRSFSVPGDSPTRTNAPTVDQAYPVMSLRRSSWWMESPSMEVVSPPPPISTSSTVSSTPRSALSSRGVSPNSGSRPSTGQYAVPVWDRPERQDVGSFPSEEIGPPRSVQCKLRCISVTPSDVARSVEEVFGYEPEVSDDNAETLPSHTSVTADQISPDEGALHWGGSTVSSDSPPGPQLSINKSTGSVQRSKVARRTSVVTSADHSMPYQVPVIQVTPSSCPASSTPSRRSSSPTSPISTPGSVSPAL